MEFKIAVQCRTVTQIIYIELIEQFAGCRILLLFEFKINSFYLLYGWTKNPVILDLFNNLKLPNPHSNLPSTFQFLPSRVQINQRKLGVVFKEFNWMLTQFAHLTTFSFTLSSNFISHWSCIDISARMLVNNVHAGIDIVTNIPPVNYDEWVLGHCRGLNWAH